MDSKKKAATVLDDIKVHVKAKLSALWVSVMFCYIYADYFGLYRPGHLEAMMEGLMEGAVQATQGVLVASALVMAIPSVMVFLSLVLKPNLNRWLNIILGVIYTLMVLVFTVRISMPTAWAFYIFFGVVEVVLTGLIVWYAWTWPKQETI
jgi:hypothetical protein